MTKPFTPFPLTGYFGNVNLCTVEHAESSSQRK